MPSRAAAASVRPHGKPGIRPCQGRTAPNREAAAIVPARLVI